MVRTIWFTLVAVAAALAVTVGAPIATGAPDKDNCPAQYEATFAPAGSELDAFDTNNNDTVCVYTGSNKKKDQVVDDTAKKK